MANASTNRDFSVRLQNCIEELRADPEVGLTLLFDLTAPRLLRMAESVTRNTADAEDAVQTGFSRIARKPILLIRADAPWPYLLRTVRNEALKIVKRRRALMAEQAHVASQATSAEAALEKEELGATVRRILDALPQAQHEVVILKFWEKLTFAEIAEVLGKSQNTVASRYRYAMEKLQRSLEPLVQEHSGGGPE